MDIGIVRGLITAVILVLFVGLWAWSWSRNRREDFDAASRMPLGEDSKPPANEDMKEQQS
jgi:cytochrome c oxidase cbb3-type subunit 4